MLRKSLRYVTFSGVDATIASTRCLCMTCSALSLCSNNMVRDSFRLFTHYLSSFFLSTYLGLSDLCLFCLLPGVGTLRDDLFPFLKREECDISGECLSAIGCLSSGTSETL